MASTTESAVHQGLVRELVQWLEQTKKFQILGADLPEYSSPPGIKNSGRLGDGQDKQPDVIAFDPTEGVYINGEAKTGDGDLTTEHTETQFRLFASLPNTANKKPSLLYIIVPVSKVGSLHSSLQRLGLFGKQNVIPLKSGLYY